MMPDTSAISMAVGNTLKMSEVMRKLMPLHTNNNSSISISRQCAKCSLGETHRLPRSMMRDMAPVCLFK